MSNDDNTIYYLEVLRQKARLLLKDVAREFHRKDEQTFVTWAEGKARPPESKTREDMINFLWHKVRLSQQKDEFERVWQILIESWGWEPLDDHERSRLGLNAPIPPAVQPAPAPVAPPSPPTPVFTSGQRKYLHLLFEDKIAQVPMRLFNPDLDTVPLIDIYVPLPVDFVIRMQAKDGRSSDWWCGRGVEDARHLSESADVIQRAIYGRMQRELATEAGTDQRERRWGELNVDEEALRPLVAIAAAENRKGKNHRFPKIERDVFTWQAEAQHAALVQRHFALVGDPGSGKSSFVRHLALCWAGELLRQAGEDAPTRRQAGVNALPGWTGRQPYLPIYIEFRRLVAHAFAPLCADAQLPLPGLAEFRAYLRAQLAPAGQDDFVDELFALLRAGRAALLLDGLDEIDQASEDGRRRQVRALMRELAREFAAAPIIVTARPIAYRDDRWRLEGFGETRLISLPRACRAALASKLLNAISLHDPSIGASFVSDLDRFPDDLTDTPLLLTLTAALWLRTQAEAAALPATRGELYDRALDLLLEDWVTHKAPDLSLTELPRRLRGGERRLETVRQLRIALQLVAYEAERNRGDDDAPSVIRDRDIEHYLIKAGLHDIAKHLFEHVEQRTGVIAPDPAAMVSIHDRQFRFAHQTFQEYLAACELLYGAAEGESRTPVVDPACYFPAGLVGHLRAAPAVWANVARLAVDELVRRRRVPDAWQLLAQCCESYLSTGKAAVPAALIALDIAQRSGLFAALPDRRVRADYDDILRAAGTAIKDINLTPEQRDIAGQLLGDGPRDDDGDLIWPPPGHDMREGVGLRADGLPDIAWQPVPDDGEFTYQDDERRTEPLFWIARYSVTYAQYRAFLEDLYGFRNPRWWLEPQPLSAPEDQRKAWGEQFFQYWNHPADNVSWYDAVAFTRWLTERVNHAADRLGLPVPEPGRKWSIRLPTEWQWEKAARGCDGRAYPWGPDYENGRANINETYGGAQGSYLGHTSAVGMYPNDKSPYDVMDMSGNVWEWCLNEHKNPENAQESGDALRTLRGGSWYNSAAAASALYRYGDWNASRSGNFGFRVVAVAVPFSSAR